MPAISPARLKKDIAELFSRMDEPEAFDRALEDLFEFYADRTVRPSQSGRPASLLPAFHVPRPVIRELEVGLAAHAADSPDKAFRLAARMWVRGIHEYMLLAVHILEHLPATYQDQAVRRLTDWMMATTDETLLGEIFRVCGRLDGAAALQTAAQMLEAKRPALAEAALTGLASLARRSDDALLPGVFKLLGRLLEDPGTVRLSRVQLLVQALAARSPAETAYFLRQYYLVSMRPEVGRLLRRSMPLFPDSIREDLRKLLQDHAAAGGEW